VGRVVAVKLLTDLLAAVGLLLVVLGAVLVRLAG